MLIGQTIRASSGVTSTFYTMAFPRQGNGMTTVVEVFRLPAGTLTIQPQHVNADDMYKTSGGWSDVSGASVAFSSAIPPATTVGKQDASALKELIRYKITLAPSGDTFAHFRILAPSWQTDGAQSA